MSRARRLLPVFGSLGFDPDRTLKSLRALPSFISAARRYRELEGGDGKFPLRVRDLEPLLGDRFGSAGVTRSHYFIQDLWAARKVFGHRPDHHVDVGSRVDGFVAHLLTFMPVTVVDVRPLPEPPDGMKVIQEDATELRSFGDRSVRSLSSLHALEHFGLGRYGDEVDPDAWRRALSAFSRVLATDGRLYLSVPVGRERLAFNAHRVFAPQTIIDTLGGLHLASFSAVDDRGNLLEDVEPNQVADSHFACGLFEYHRLG